MNPIHERILDIMREEAARDWSYTAPWRLSEQLGVDYRAIAVALKRMEQEGLVECVNGGGPHWAGPDGGQVGSSVWALPMSSADLLTFAPSGSGLPSASHMEAEPTADPLCGIGTAEPPIGGASSEAGGSSGSPSSPALWGECAPSGEQRGASTAQVEGQRAVPAGEGA